jgi:hypothetical protein
VLKLENTKHIIEGKDANGLPVPKMEFLMVRPGREVEAASLRKYFSTLSTHERAGVKTDLEKPLTHGGVVALSAEEIREKIEKLAKEPAHAATVEQLRMGLQSLENGPRAEQAASALAKTAHAMSTGANAAGKKKASYQLGGGS